MKKQIKLKSFIEVNDTCDFPIENLPYGIIQPKGYSPRVGVAIGDFALDLSVLVQEGLLKLPINCETVFDQVSLNSFAQLGRPVWLDVRIQIQNLLSIDNPTLKDNLSLRKKAFWNQIDIDLLLPFSIGGYTDFYASQVHATNIGRIYRGEENALMPNWKHIPIAYNGRASSVIVSGTPVVRPKGQIKSPTNPAPTFEVSKKLDIEVEVGFFIGKNSQLGKPISATDANEYIFGLVLLNDWSARDIQAWEYQPLGPFLGKSFATTISPWVVPILALEEAMVELQSHDPEPLPYLRGTQYGYDIEITAELKPSGPAPENWGSLVERSYNGKECIPIANNEDRTFLLDGDEVILHGSAVCNGSRIGFGQALGRVI